MTSSTLTASGQNTAITVAYNGIGNITSKSDIGSYSYGPNTTSCGATAFAGPHAVSNVSGQKAASYCYDANGNLTAGDTRTVTWSAFNMPTLMAQGTRSIEVAYGPDRTRFKRIDRNETGTTTTFYVAGGTHEIVKQGSTIKAKTYIGGIAVVTETTTTPTATEIIYLHHDHLGSTDVVTDATGAVTDRFSFDAWGKRRNVTWAAFVGGPPATIWQMQKTTRGYTGHEQLDPIGLIHMNARIYDPELGRFLSADSVIQNPSDLQSLNRYSYVQNNPLSFTDPTGHFLSGLFKAIGNFFGNVFKAIGQVFKAILGSSIVRSLLQLAVCAAVPGVGCAAAGALLTLASGGSIGDAVKSFAFAIISVNVWGGTGDALMSAGTGLGGSLTRVLVHGVVGGALSVAQGGNFLQGFVSAGAGQAAGLAVGTGGDTILKSAIIGAVGGTATVLTGGKFANGAITAGFAYLFNQVAHAQPTTVGGIAVGSGDETVGWLFRNFTPLGRVFSIAEWAMNTNAEVTESNNDSERMKGEVEDKVPSEWGDGQPNRKGAGWRWQDPENKGNGVRVDEGNPESLYPTQQEDHVIVNDNGKVIGRDGNPINGSVKDNYDTAHIPLKEYKGWSSWNRP